MKKIIFQTVIVSLALAVGLPLMAADTGQINYQARLLDAYGRRVNDTVDLSFKIYDAVTDGNLLWSETQADVVVQDGVYSVVLGSQTAIPSSVFSQNTVYLELGINSETMTPRQQITASAYSLVARTIMGSNVYENQTSGYLGVGTTNPAAKLDVSGTVQATGFKMPTGATVNYVLASDASGVGTWQPFSAVLVEYDPIFTNWVQVVYTPATNSIWTSIGAEATTRAAADTVLQNNIDSSSNASQVQITALQGATNTLNTATNSLQTKITTLNTATNSLNLATNALQIQVAANTTGKVSRAGDTMTGALIISNNLTIALTNGAGATNYISLGGMPISNWNQVTGGDLTNALVQLQGATGTLNSAVTVLNTATGTLNTATNSVNATVNLLATATNTLNTATNSMNATVNLLVTATNTLNLATNSLQSKITTLNTATNELNLATNSLQSKITTLNTATNELNLATNSLQSKITTLNTATNDLNTRAVSWDNAIVMKQVGAGTGVTIAYSNLYYLGGNAWSNASALSNTTAQGLLGLAMTANGAAGGLLLNGTFSNHWGFAPGAIIYMGTGVSQITATAPTGTNNIVRILGYALTTTNIFFNPDRTYIELLGQ